MHGAWRCRTAFAAWTCLAALCARAAVADPHVVQGAPSQTESADTWQVTTREQDIAEILDACAALLETPIEFNKAELSGSFTLRLPPRATPHELWQITNRALAARGFTSVQMPGSASLTIVPIASATSLARLEEGSLRAAKAGFVKALFELTHDRAETTAEAIKLVLSKNGAVNVFKDSKAILVSDYLPNVQDARRVASAFDGPYAEMDVDEVAVAHLSPVALVALIERITNSQKVVFGEKAKGTVLAHPEGRSVLILAPKIELDVWRALIERFDRAEPLVTSNYSPRRFGLKETARLIEDVVHEKSGAETDRWRLVTDTLSGTLVITATPSQHARIEELFDRLETAAASGHRPIRSFAIRHRGAEELLDLLRGLLDAGALEGASQVANAAPALVTPASTPQGPTGPIPNAPSAPVHSDGLGDEVILACDKATNRLIAMGDPRVLEQLGALIEELDVRHAQVMVEAIVVTLTDTQARSLGVELQHVGVNDDVQARLSSLFGLGSPDPQAATLPPPGGVGFSGVVLDPGSFSAAVRALEVVNKGRTLTIPKVLVNNNEPAELNSVLQTPFASTNASTTVATTSFGGTVDAGTQISVTPQIANGDQLVLDYSVSISAFVGTSTDPALPPPRQENKLKSVVTIPDGYTVVVGGLEIATDSTATNELPLLGRIPILGALFGTTTKVKERTRFFVFLRCSVLRSGGFDDLKHLSEQVLAAAKVDDGWPELEPRVIR